MKINDIKIIDDMQEIVMIENEIGVLKYVNEAFCKCHGVTKEEAIGKSVFEFIIPEDREACNVEQVVTPENPFYRITGRSKRVDGKIIWLQYVGRAYFNDKGERIEFQEIAVDITQWKEKIDESAKALAKANQKISQGFGNELIEKKIKTDKISRDGNYPAMHKFTDICTANPKMKALKSYANSVASGNATILIQGESGTGKELFAQAIHNASKRANGPFVAVNCGVIPAELIGSEFFGYAEGAFTGASKGGKPGKFEMASGGTLFLDEIGEMPLAQQVALLRVLETKTVSRIGDNKQIPVDVRIICATNRNLIKEVQDGRFRNDLYYRLNVINLHIPPLRERKEDVFLLIGAFIKKYGSHKFNKERVFGDKHLMSLYRYNWPGNIRELQNVVERLMYMPEESYDGTMDFFIEDLEKKEPAVLIETAEEKNETQSEKSRIAELMVMYEGNISMVSRKLGISRNTLYKKLKKYGIKY